MSSDIPRRSARTVVRSRATRSSLNRPPLKFLWWDDFRVIYAKNARRQQLYDDSNSYAPILTVVGLPSNQFANF